MSLYAILRRVSMAVAVGMTLAIAIVVITLGEIAGASHATANPAYPPTLPCALSVSHRTLSGAGEAADEASVPSRARQLVAASPSATCPTNTPPHSTPSRARSTPDSSSATNPPPPAGSTSSSLTSQATASAGQGSIGVTLAVAAALVVLGGLGVLLLTRRSGWRSG
jgi:hypothetical protein